MPKKIISTLIAVLAGAILALIGGATVNMAVTPKEDGTLEFNVDTKYSLEVSETQPEIPVEVTENGETKVVDVVTVEEVDGGEIPTEFDGKTESELNLGRGEWYDTTTPESFLATTYGKCIDMDGWFGSMCVDYFAAFNYEENGYWLDTCGTGAARGLWDCAEQNSRGNYELITDPTQLQPGDWAIFNGGVYGHVGMVYGYYDNGYILLAGENQGGAACAGGGAAVNVINMSLSSFRGAFRPNKWVIVEPEPVEPSYDDATYYYVEGDTFGQVILNLGLATEQGLWGKEGDVEYYNGQLYDQGILNYYDGKFWNNIPVGTEIKLEHR